MSSKSVKLTTFKRPLIIAHRGYRAKYPENTLASFKAAVDAGVQMIELDVMLSKDRKVVVIHDATLERTTNGYGPVNCYKIKKLRALDTGSWFHPRFAGERIPTLEEVLDHMRERTMINIEIKPSAYEAHRPADAIERQVIELVRRNSMQASVLISSFEWKILDRIAMMEDAPAVALLSRHPADRNNLELCIRLKAFSWHPSCRELRGEHVELMHESGIYVFPYHVESPEDYQKVMQMHVDGVITSDPLMIRESGES
jgi:glycerophosphoryl diester phosphodiesterase